MARTFVFYEYDRCGQPGFDDGRKQGRSPNHGVNGGRPQLPKSLKTSAS